MSASQFLRRCITPGRPERAVALSLLLGAAALIDPAKLGPGTRALYRTALAGVSAAAVASDADDELSTETRLAAAVAAGGATLGLAQGAEALDARLQRALRRRGVSKPRLIFAAASTALSLAVELPALRSAAAKRRATAGGTSSGIPESADGHTLAPLPEGARAMIAGMLDFSADPSSSALRAQLASANERLWEGVSGSFDIISLVVDEPDALPRAVPYDQGFPVSAQFVDPDSGRARVVRLRIESGQLAELSIEDLDDGSGDESDRIGSIEAGSWPATWPAIAEITFEAEDAAPVDARAARLARSRGRA